MGFCLQGERLKGLLSKQLRVCALSTEQGGVIVIGVVRCSSRERSGRNRPGDGRRRNVSKSEEGY